MKPNQTLGELLPELHLMLACATHGALHPKLKKIKVLLSQSLDWKLFVQYTMNHRVYPLVYKTLGNIPETYIPERVLTALRTKCRENTMQALRMVGETARVVANLQECGIQSVVIKGPPLAQLLYGDVTLRPSHDLDLLVWPANLVAAGTILEQRGYRRIHPNVPLTPRMMRFLLQKDHHFSYYQERTGVLLELHWRLDHCGVELPLPGKNELTTCSLGGREIPVLTAEYGLLSLILHGAGHSWFRLRWLCDIGKYLEQELDWEKLLRLADHLGVRTHFNQALILADQLLGAPIPEVYRTCLAHDRQAWRLAQMAVSFLQKADYHPDDSRQRRNWRLWVMQKRYGFQIRVGWRSRVGYAWSHFKPAETDWQLISLPEVLYPVYYLIRPFTWLWRRMVKKLRV